MSSPKCTGVLLLQRSQHTAKEANCKGKTQPQCMLNLEVEQATLDLKGGMLGLSCCTSKAKCRYT